MPGKSSRRHAARRARARRRRDPKTRRRRRRLRRVRPRRSSPAPRLDPARVAPVRPGRGERQRRRSRRPRPASRARPTRRRRRRRARPARASTTGMACATVTQHAVAGDREPGARRGRRTATVMPPSGGPHRVDGQQVAEDDADAPRTGSARPGSGPSSRATASARHAHAERDARRRRAGRCSRRPSGSRSATLVAEVGCAARSGVRRSWRFQPTERSAAMRAPPAITAVIVPERDQADHVVERRGDRRCRARSCSSPVGPRDEQVHESAGRPARR